MSRERVYEEMNGAFGLVPSFFKSVPEDRIGAELDDGLLLAAEDGAECAADLRLFAEYGTERVESFHASRSCRFTAGRRPGNPIVPFRIPAQVVRGGLADRPGKRHHGRSQSPL